MAYVPKIFVDRSVEFPFRRLLTPVAGQANTVDVSRVPGTVFAVGDEPDAANLNAEFGKIKTETDAINSSLQDTKDSLLKPPNYNNLLTTITPNANGGVETYTAIQDCWIGFSGYGHDGKETKLYVDNKEIASVYSGGSTDIGTTSMFYAKKDSVVKIINDTSFAYAYMKIYSTI